MQLHVGYRSEKLGHVITAAEPAGPARRMKDSGDAGN